MSSSVAPASTATSASWAFTAGWWAPLGNPITVATPMPTPRPSVIGRCDGDTQTAATPRSGGLLAQRDDVVGGGLRREQRVVDRRGERGSSGAVHRLPSCPPCRSPSSTTRSPPSSSPGSVRPAPTGPASGGRWTTSPGSSCTRPPGTSRWSRSRSRRRSVPPWARLSRPPLVVPVLRAGLGMLGGVLRHLPETDTGFIGVARNEETFVPSPT